MRPSLPASLSRTLFTIVLLLAGHAAASTEKVLHQFINASHGAAPGQNLISDAQGNLYGTTYYGGTYGYGTVFELTRNASGKWQQTVLYSFTGFADGGQPNSLAMDSAGNLFGGTNSGGNSTYSGVVFELSRQATGSWTETVLHAFSGASVDGALPAGILLDSAGNIYGIAGGGIGNLVGCGGYCGIVFRLTHSKYTWTDTTLYEFKGEHDGGIPIASLAMDSADNLYGAVIGDLRPQVIYQLTPTTSGRWTETTLLALSNPAVQGGYPAGITLDAQGNIYGAAQNGGSTNNGLIFKLVRGSTGEWTQQVLYNFAGGSDASAPAGPPTFDSAGNLYGVTYGGGSGSCLNGQGVLAGCGAAYKLTPTQSGTWNESVAYSFKGGADGLYPAGSVVVGPGATVAGITVKGTAANLGAVFELAPSSGVYSEALLYGFPATDGEYIQSGLVADAAGNLFGTATYGGLQQCSWNGISNWCGSVFKLTRQSNGMWQRTTLHDFSGQNGDGYYSVSSLTIDSVGNLYGTTNLGGSKGYGVVFKLSPTALGQYSYSILHDFGSAPHDSQWSYAPLLIDSQGDLYGTSAYGGTAQSGTVFKLSPGSSGKWTETILYNFLGLSDGSYPFTGLAMDSAGNLYGTTYNYLYNRPSLGSVFKLAPNSGGTWTQSVLFTFTGASTGWGDPSAVVLDSAGNLYGTTPYGGSGACSSSGCGIVYKLAPTSSGPWTETILYNFTELNGDGAIPFASLTFDLAGNLYGTTQQGGSFCGPPNTCSGTVFKLTPSASSWTESIVHSFAGPPSDGGSPVAPVILDSAGKIYGTTSYGGVGGTQYYSGGTVFEITP